MLDKQKSGLATLEKLLGVVSKTAPNDITIKTHSVYNGEYFQKETVSFVLDNTEISVTMESKGESNG